MKRIKIFIDSDVVISSLLSAKGSSYALIHNTKFVDHTISNYSYDEISLVCIKLKIQAQKFKKITNKFQNVQIKRSISIIKKTYSIYVYDKNDAHIIGGVIDSGCKFLITYNLKDYRINKIKNELDVIVMTPGNFLQYLRLLEKYIY